MALTLRSTTSVERSDKIASLLDRIITPDTHAAAKQFQQAKDTQRSEFEAYMERETWAKMKTERDKDMVLMFGDDDVRIFKRNPSNQLKAVKLRSAGKTNHTLSKQDLADVSGLIPVALDTRVVDTVTGANGEYVPYSKEERQRVQQRRQEILLRRQQLANQYVFVSQNAANAALQQQSTLHAQHMAELGIVLPSDTSRGEEPSQIPLKAWQTWIPRRGEHVRDGKDANAANWLSKRRQRRHHRLNCKYHPFSTNAEMRRLAIQSSFPRRSLLQSIDRVQHATNGASNGEGHRLDVEACFAPVQFVCPQPVPSPGHNPRNVVSFASSSNGISSSGAGGVGAARMLRKTSSDNESTQLQALSLADGVDDTLLDVSVLNRTAPNNTTTAPLTPRSATANATFLTDTNITRRSALEKCSVPPLAPFERPPRPHSVEGTFVDCDCTPRLTDDELDMFGIREMSNSPPKTGKSKDGEDDKKKKPSTPLLGSAARAEKRLEVWRRDFIMTNVHCGSALHSLLDEREENRSFVTAERQHLNLVTHEAELSGADFYVSRRHRCTTPMRASMWTPVFDAIGEDVRHIVRNATTYASILDHCEELGIPSQQWEFELLDEIRQRCVENSMIRRQVSPVKSGHSSREHTPTRQTQSRPVSQQSLPPSRDARRKSSLFAASGGSSSSFSPAPTVGGGGNANTTASTIAGGERSVFVALSKKAQPLTSGGSNSGSDSSAFTEDLAMWVLESYGARLLKSKAGVEAANLIREHCQMSNKVFMAFLFSKESVWDMSPDVHNLQKRLASTAK